MTEQTQIVHTPTTALGMPAQTVKSLTERYSAIEELYRNVLREGVDYGNIPSVDKPVLSKAGAEKLAAFFGLTVHLPPEKADHIEDWAGERHGEPFFKYRYCCEVRLNGTIIAEAYGSCNSFESKYRWRWVPEHEVPSDLDKDELAKRGGTEVEYDFAIDKAETSGKYGKPAEYWQAWRDAIQSGEATQTTKKARSGKVLDAWEMDTTVYRVPNEDIYSQVNTIDKMAQKRAYVAGVLIATGASSFFTQDLDDMESYMGASRSTTTVEHQTSNDEAAESVSQRENGEKPQAPEQKPADNGQPEVTWADFHAAANDAGVPYDVKQKIMQATGGNPQEALARLDKYAREEGG